MEATKQDQLREFVFKNVYSSKNLLIHELLNSDELAEDIYEEFFSSYDEEYDEYREPLEFWEVSEHLAARLEREGGVVSYYFGSPVWGRETSGQAIYLDYIIERAFEDK